MKGSGEAALVSPRDRHLGVTLSATRANVLRIRMQNRTALRRMRVWWQTARQPTWKVERSVAFDVVPMDGDDRVYAVPMPAIPGVTEGAPKGFPLGPGACGVGSARDLADWRRILPAAEADGTEWLVVKPTAYPDALDDLAASARYLRTFDAITIG